MNIETEMTLEMLKGWLERLPKKEAAKANKEVCSLIYDFLISKGVNLKN